MQIDKLYHYKYPYGAEKLAKKGMKPSRPLFTICLENNESMFSLPDEWGLHKFKWHPILRYRFREDIRRGRSMPEYAHDLYTYCLSEPIPQNWVESGEFARLMRHHQGIVGRIPGCVEVTLVPDDEIYVVDWSLMIPQPMPSEKFDVAQKRYIKSRVTLEDYVEGSYELPEFLIRNFIPPERLRVLSKEELIKAEEEYKQNHNP